MADTQVTWLGHAAFRIDSPGGKRIYVDPWLDNPKCPDGEKEPERIDMIVLTHGHGDHVGSTPRAAQRFSPGRRAGRGAGLARRPRASEGLEIPAMNKGGTRRGRRDLVSR